MPNVIGVRFRTSPRIYWFTPNADETYEKGMKVVVETQRGVELATVAELPHEVEEEKLVAPLKGITRIATEADLEAERADSARKQEILALAKEKAAARGLDMKIVDCEFTVDHSKLVLYFTAEQRVDFRELVRDLASAFRIRIDLRQIGPRDECKLIGSLAPCGLPCCCGRFESDNEHVSIKMAKNQNLALTPGKINGMCGRLLCCLAYENKTYEDIMKRMPKHGAIVTAPDGRRGSVVSVTPLTERVRVRFGDDENFEFAEFPLEELDRERGDRRDDRQDRRDDREERSERPDKKDRDRRDRREHKDRQDKPQKEHGDNARRDNDRKDNDNNADRRNDRNKKRHRRGRGGKGKPNNNGGQGGDKQ